MLPRKTASLFWQLPSPAAVEHRNRFWVSGFNRGFLKWGNPQSSFILTGFSSINHPANISELGVPEFMDPHGDFPSLFVRVRLHLPIILQVPSRNFPSRNLTINLPSHFCQVKKVHIFVIFVTEKYSFFIFVIFVTEKGPYFCHHQIPPIFPGGCIPAPQLRRIRLAVGWFGELREDSQQGVTRRAQQEEEGSQQPSLREFARGMYIFLVRVKHGKELYLQRFWLEKHIFKVNQRFLELFEQTSDVFLQIWFKMAESRLYNSPIQVGQILQANVREILTRLAYRQKFCKTIEDLP